MYGIVFIRRFFLQKFILLLFMALLLLLHKGKKGSIRSCDTIVIREWAFLKNWMVIRQREQRGYFFKKNCQVIILLFFLFNLNMMIAQIKPFFAVKNSVLLLQIVVKRQRLASVVKSTRERKKWRIAYTSLSGWLFC